MINDSECFIVIACVINIYSQKDYFNSLNEEIINKLSLDDNHTIKVMCIDKMKIRMVNKIIHILHDTAYALKM